jgi:rare lipoprotein A
VASGSSRIKISALLLFIALLLSFCARREYFPPPGVQKGLASWYGPKFQGKTTSNTEIYNMYDMTAAHRSLPFGTMVMVTNLNNGKSVIVRINDRGPFIRGRIIDLSYAAARMLDMVGEGVAPVKIEVIDNYYQENQDAFYAVQVGAFISKKNALALKKKLQKKYREVYITEFTTPVQSYYRVRIKAKSLASAQRIAAKLIQEGYPALLIKGKEFRSSGSKIA